MSKVSISGDQNGTGNFTIKAPDSNTDRVLDLPDEVGKFLTDSGALNVDPSAPTQSATIDSSGNLLVGKTSPGISSSGHSFRPEGVLEVRRDIATAGSSSVGYISRGNSDGNIITFYRDTSAVGSIFNDGLRIGIGINSCALRFEAPFSSGGFIMPRNANTGGVEDGVISFGDPNQRFEDIYLSGGVVNSSDLNLKQDVRGIEEAEVRVARKAKSLLLAFRYKDAVSEKDNNPDSDETARIHFGIIAQDLEQAFIDEGLDAGRYGMFIRGEWWETEVEKTRTVENDDGTETTETYMATETYDTAEEAPADAVHKERLGVRYHELLAFIIAAI